MYNTRCRSLKASNNVLECKVVLVVTAASGTAGAKVPPDFRHQLAESLRPVRSVEAGRAGRARRLTDQLVQLRLDRQIKTSRDTLSLTWSLGRVSSLTMTNVCSFLL